ncbi:hypothetical protein Pcinc_002753 [Petrolisthes cinctipes]|uniref:Uncharacterized protein n=1 Tax=Petrolisthes cinctipes TaxID=88211 RepID=A0AAE1GIL0_PETCI|nr:hypothetical protein Pcinc_002753 [Petrolisthes cinctipes]
MYSLHPPLTRVALPLWSQRVNDHLTSAQSVSGLGRVDLGVYVSDVTAFLQQVESVQGDSQSDADHVTSTCDSRGQRQPQTSHHAISYQQCLLYSD